LAWSVLMQEWTALVVQATLAGMKSDEIESDFLAHLR